MTPRTTGGTPAPRPVATIEDVASAAGVSTATVSRALRGLPRVAGPTRTRILGIADALGYTASAFATGLATGRTRSIGVVTPSLRHPAYSAAVEGAERALHDRDYSLVLLQLPRLSASSQHVTDLNGLCRRVDALLILGAGTLGQDHIEQLQRNGTAHIVIALHAEQDNCFESQAVSLAIRHLAKLGHTDLVLFHDEPRIRSLLRRQAPGPEDWTNILNADDVLPREVRIESRPEVRRSAQTAFERLWAEPGAKPTAIVCASDEMALGVLLGAARKGVRIPEDLSIVGIDGQNLAEALGLTAVIHDPARSATGGIRRLLDVLGGHDSDSHPSGRSSGK